MLIRSCCVHNGAAGTEHRVEGSPLPRALLDRLRATLSSLRWPATRARKGVSSERYLVLYHGRRNDGYDGLMALLEELVAWACPDHGYTMIAVTKVRDEFLMHAWYHACLVHPSVPSSTTSAVNAPHARVLLAAHHRGSLGVLLGWCG